jgi:hypothetical protein
MLFLQLNCSVNIKHINNFTHKYSEKGASDEQIEEIHNELQQY